MVKLHSIKAFCQTYGIGRTKTYELIAAGAVEARKLGGRTMICAESAERWADGLPRFQGRSRYQEKTPPDSRNLACDKNERAA